MHFLVVGCGAVGGYFAGRLAEHGEQVTFAARGESLRLLQQNGLSIKSITGDVHLTKLTTLDVEAINGAQPDLPVVDVMLLAVKSYQLQTAIKQIKPLITNETRVIPLLNGIDAHNELINGGIAKNNIYGGLAKIIAEKTSDGKINHTGAKPHITLGQFLTDQHKVNPDEAKTLANIARSFTCAGISVGVTSHIELALWRKFIFVGAWGALAAAKQLTLGQIRVDAHLQFLLECIVKEYAMLGRALNVPLTDKHITETLGFLAKLPDTSETSLQRDIASGASTEFDILVAAPFHLARKFNIHSPVLTQCYQQITITL